MSLTAVVRPLTQWTNNNLTNLDEVIMKTTQRIDIKTVNLVRANSTRIGAFFKGDEHVGVWSDEDVEAATQAAFMGILSQLREEGLLQVKVDKFSREVHACFLDDLCLELTNQLNNLIHA